MKYAVLLLLVIVSACSSDVTSPKVVPDSTWKTLPFPPRPRPDSLIDRHLVDVHPPHFPPDTVRR
jgi:hypothetical protein